MAFLCAYAEVLSAQKKAGGTMNTIDAMVRCLVFAALVAIGTIVVRNVNRALTDAVGGPFQVTMSAVR